MSNQKTCELQNLDNGAFIGLVSLPEGIESGDIAAAIEAGTVVVVDRPKPKPAKGVNREPLGTA